MDKFIIFNLDDITTHKTDFYLFIYYQYLYTTHQFFNFNSITKSLTLITYLMRDESYTVGADKVGVSRQVWTQSVKNYPSILTIIDTPSAFLNHNLFNEMARKTADLGLKTKNFIWRIYGYLLFMDGRYGSKFQYSQEQMAKELDVSLKNLNKTLKQFVDWGWLEKKGKFKFSGEQTFSYIYQIPSRYKSELKLRDEE